MEPPPALEKEGPPGFQPASALPRSTHAPALSSNRNATGGLPPLPPPPPPLAAAAAKDNGDASSSTPTPQKPVNRPAASKNAIVHSVLQRRNPILPLIRNVGLEIGDIVADYQVGAHSGVLFLSLKYHRLHPEYIFTRIEKMKNMYNLRVLLILCDITEHQQPLRELSKVAVVNDLTIIVAFSNEEAAQYLTTLKAYEHKSADTLKERIRQNYPEQLEHVLTSGRKVNKANAETLSATFGSFANMARQPSTILTSVKGIGPTKTLSLYRAFNEPFVAGTRSKPSISRIPPIEDRPAKSNPQTTLAASLQQGTATLPSPPGPMPLSPIVDTEHIPRTPPTPTRPVDEGPSRSPSVEPDPERTATEEVWHDPLDDDSDSDEPAAKRARI